MKIYLVGGAVRDRFLGLPIREKDYVVVGATPEEMTAQGFKPVGRDFPVFLHPKTHEEYALARTERKVARGHQGFQFYTNPTITLEEDLARRDLTINAMAEDEHGNIIDPYHGQQDLQNHILRHVSAAFAEDPLRILRVARFAAYLGKFNFTIASDTLALMQQMVRDGTLKELSNERVWQELYRALQTDDPQRFFETLQEVEAIPYLFNGLPHIINHSNPLINFAVLSFKANYLKQAPHEFTDLAHLTRNQFAKGLQFQTFTAEEKVQFLHQLDFLRRPERLENFLTACKALNSHFPVKAILAAITILKKLDRKEIAKQSTDIKAAIFQAECAALLANTTPNQ